MKTLSKPWKRGVPPREFPSEAWRQVVAVATVIVVLLIKLGLEPIIGQEQTPFLLFPAAIVVSAWYGGWRSGLTSLILSALLVNSLYLPRRDTVFFLASDATVRLAVFLVEGAVICLLAEKLHHLRRVADQRAREAALAWHTASQQEIEIHHVQEQLSSRDLLFRHLSDANVLGVISCRIDGRIDEANTAFLQMTEFSAEELAAGKINWRELTPPELESVDQQLLEQLQTTGRFEPANKEYVLRSGKRLPVLIAGAFTPQRDRVVCFVMDRTLQQQAEQALIQAKEAAERSNRTRGEFLANVSHELRTPMNAILGMTELALDEELPAHIRDYLETAIGASRTLLYLLDDLLDFSRIEAGKIDLDELQFSLQNTMDQAMRILGMRAAEKGLELTCSIASDLPDRLVGDQGRLRQIVLNLVSNAIKFTTEGEVSVEVTGAVTHVKDDLDRSEVLTLHLLVKDTGIGIRETDQQRIFEPFTQVDASLTRLHGGTGLGLAIVRQLVQRMGGEISVASREGAGTSFSVKLTFPVASPEPVSTTRAGGQLQSLRGVRVLVVDDNQTNRTILRDILRSWAMIPVIVPDAHRALQEMRQAERDGHEFGVILVDAMMPAMDGLQFIRTATSEGLLHGTTILMISSTDRRALEPQLQSVPVNGVLGKPISQSELLDTLMDSLLGNSPPVPLSNQIRQTRHVYRVLVAEDAPANQKVVKAILEKRGHIVTFANNGREAIEKVQQTTFDVVLMDVQMPLLDGWEATREIRRLDGRSMVPIIAMTAHAMRGDREKCLAVGMDDYISKPLDAHELIRMVERIAGQRIREGTVFPMLDPSATPAREQRESTATATSVSGLLIDVEGTLSRMGGETELMRDMAGFFVQDVPVLMRTIQEYRQGDEATRAAHSLRGLAANFGAQSVMDLASVIETPATPAEQRERAINDLAALLPRVYAELQQRVIESR